MTAAPVGVLALQGDFREHLAVLTALGAHAVPVRRERELDRVRGLVIPGGESTVMDRLSRAFGLREPLRARIADGMPVYGTCAGLIMLSDRVLDALPDQQTLGGLDVTVQRNAFGNQLDSFETDLDVPVLGAPPVHAAFIRAPLVAEVGPAATAIATLDDPSTGSGGPGRVVAVQQGTLLGTAFHPEITGETRFHELFLSLVPEH